MPEKQHGFIEPRKLVILFKNYMRSLSSTYEEMSRYHQAYHIPLPIIPAKMAKFVLRVPGHYPPYLLCEWSSLDRVYLSFAGKDMKSDTTYFALNLLWWPVYGTDLARIAEVLSSRSRMTYALICHLERIHQWYRKRLAGMHRHLQLIQQQVESSKAYRNLQGISDRAETMSELEGDWQ